VDCGRLDDRRKEDGCIVDSSSRGFNICLEYTKYSSGTAGTHGRSRCNRSLWCRLARLGGLQEVLALVEGLWKVRWLPTWPIHLSTLLDSILTQRNYSSLDFDRVDIEMRALGAQYQLPGINADGDVLVRPCQHQARVVALG